MPDILLEQQEGIFIITINRGKVNAINEGLVSELSQLLDKLEVDKECNSIIITGSGSFYSFGFDIPELLSYSRKQFFKYLSDFNNLIKQIFLYPKPLISSINGHCIAGGCVIALATDYRIMNDERAKISINEINFGSTLFSSALEILKYTVGGRNAEKILLSGEMYKAEEALKYGLVDEICSKTQLHDKATEIAREYSGKDSIAFYSLKKMSRMNTMEIINRHQDYSLKEFVEIWYSKETREKLKNIQIHE